MFVAEIDGRHVTSYVLPEAPSFESSLSPIKRGHAGQADDRRYLENAFLVAGNTLYQLCHGKCYFQSCTNQCYVFSEYK